MRVIQKSVAKIFIYAILLAMEKLTLEQLLDLALRRRHELGQCDLRHRGAWRLFNGFTECVSDLAIDLMGRTAVIHDYGKSGLDERAVLDFLLARLDFLQSVIVKKRNSTVDAERNGIIIYGEKPDTFVEEYGVRYAVDLSMNHDNGFYSDTRYLRKYLWDNMQNKSVLNTFAYTGSLGVAAAAGGAKMVLQTDLSNKFLQTAYRSASLNSLTFTRKNFKFGDFFPVIAALRKERAKFDCVIVDPPFFSRTAKGVIDQVNNPLGVINKVRPLVAAGGVLIAVNNSLYLSGREFMEKIESICDDRYLAVEQFIPIPEDFCFRSDDAALPYPADPAPFNHPTKIVVLRVLL